VNWALRKAPKKSRVLLIQSEFTLARRSIPEIRKFHIGNKELVNRDKNRKGDPSGEGGGGGGPGNGVGALGMSGVRQQKKTHSLVEGGKKKSGGKMLLTLGKRTGPVQGEVKS